MKKEQVIVEPFKLVGLTARTCNKNEFDPEVAKIGKLVGEYFGNQLANQIKHRIHPSMTYAIYTDYESNEHGEYTYFIGEVVDSFEDQDLSLFKTLIVLQGKYQKFTTEKGQMPNVVISAWQAIWQMNQVALGGERNYVADFEVYDERAVDPNKTIVDIYIGIK